MSDRRFDPNRPDARHICAAILTAGFAPILIKKKAKNINLKQVTNLFWDFFDNLYPPAD